MSQKSDSSSKHESLKEQFDTILSHGVDTAIALRLRIPLMQMDAAPTRWKKVSRNPNYRLTAYQSKVKTQQTQAVDELKSKWYQYAPLEDHQIRLLHILAESNESKVEFTMETVSLDDENIQFHALSYTWGDPTHTHHIHCGEKVIPIGESLWTALQNIRQTEATAVFWIDAVCINQNDVAERSAQVRLMDIIYSRASAVVAWLGTGDETSESAYKLIYRIHEAQMKVPAHLATRTLKMDDLKELGLNDIEWADWESFDALIWRPWFMRIWIVQEITLPRNAYLMCGKDSVLWDTFLWVVDFMANRLMQVVDAGYNLNSIYPLQSLKGTYGSGVRLPLLSLLGLFRTSLSTDPADKVYALLGLAASHSIVPDYSLSYDKVFLDLGKHFLQDSLDVLSHVEDMEWKSHEDIPSWVPDWSAHRYATPFLQWESENFKACGSTPPSVCFSSGGKRLIVKGCIIDQVNRMSALMRSMDRVIGPVHKNTMAKLVGEKQKTLLKNHGTMSFRGCEVLVLGLKKYPTGEDINSVLARLMVADEAIPIPIASDQEGPENQQLLDAETEKLDLMEGYSIWHRAHATYEFEGSYLRGDERSALNPKLFAYYQRVIKTATGRRIFTTKKGYVGWGPWGTAKGHVIALFEGGKTAYVLREGKSKDTATKTYSFIGEAYLHGFMNGEGFGESYQPVEFELV